MKPFRLDTWNHLILEGYCGIQYEYDQKHSKYIYKLNKIENTEDPLDWEKEPNPMYDPTIQPNEKPEYCKGKISLTCLGSGEGMCPYFNWCGVEKKVKKNFRKMINKLYRN